MLDTKLQTSSTVQLDTSSCSLGLSDCARFDRVLGLLDDDVFIRALFKGGAAAADRSKGDDASCRFTLFSSP